MLTIFPELEPKGLHLGLDQPGPPASMPQSVQFIVNVCVCVCVCVCVLVCVQTLAFIVVQGVEAWVKIRNICFISLNGKTNMAAVKGHDQACLSLS